MEGILRRLTVAEMAGQMTQININEVMTGSIRQVDLEKVQDPYRHRYRRCRHRPPNLPACPPEAGWPCPGRRRATLHATTTSGRS